MLSFLFPRLTPGAKRGEAAFAAVTAAARQPHWYLDGGIPDTIDGRFAVLATIAALIIVRLEQLGDEGEAVSVALTERFIECMEAEHREFGLGDPTLGKTVRLLVGSLAHRVEIWRSAVAGMDGAWADATDASLSAKAEKAPVAAHNAAALRDFWGRLLDRSASELRKGQIA